MGWRPGKEEGTVGSLILGLHEPDGRLRPVGHTSGFNAKQKRELPAKLAPYETGERGTGDPSRWDNERELEWIELRPELVVEVTFDHTSNDRIRHGAKVLRWRATRTADCRRPASVATRSAGRRAVPRGRPATPAAGRTLAAPTTSPVLEPQPRAAPARRAGARPPARARTRRARARARRRGARRAVALELAQRRAEHPPGHAVDLRSSSLKRCVPIQAREHDDAPLGREDRTAACRAVLFRVPSEGGRPAGNDVRPRCVRCIRHARAAASRGWSSPSAPCWSRPTPSRARSRARGRGAIGRGLERAGLMPPDLCPVADGGEGTLDALLPSSAASWSPPTCTTRSGARSRRASRWWRTADRDRGDRAAAG